MTRAGSKMAKGLLSLFLSLVLAGCNGVGTVNAISPESLIGLGTVHKPTPSLIDSLMEETFRQTDGDGDRLLSERESDLTHAQFRLLDRDNNGVVDSAEWIDPVDPTQIGKRVSAFYPLMDDLHHYFDTDQDGLVTENELLGEALSQGDYAVLAPAALRAALQKADSDHNGALDRDEFRNFCLEAATADPTAGEGRHGIARAVLGAYLALASAISTKIALHPERRPLGETPREFGYEYEDVAFRTSDGLLLKGWYIPAARATDKAVITQHGYFNTRSVTVHRRILPMLHDEYNVLAIDLRNHGESDGNVTTYGYYEYLDELAAMDFLRSRGNRAIAVHGFSLGGATIIRAAALSPDLRAVIDDCAFATVLNAFTGFITRARFPSPRLVAAATLANSQRLLGIDLSSTQPITQMPRLAPRPLLVIHGADDALVAVENSRMNFEAAGTHLYKELWIVPKAGHGGSALAAPAEYRKRLLALLHRVM